ncbi:MAG: ABC transporter permease [Spirochaeta sp. LUC14_002_19_P3]|nr:MAG: ABC transporter permease [Spirochaeta sp. LUC14_002_19_P3]
MVSFRRLAAKLCFAALVLFIVLFAVFPFLQMLSMSLKHQWDWGNPSLVPRQINLEAYKELLNIDQMAKNVPESVKILLEESDLTRQQREAILEKYRDSSDIFPFVRYFRNSLLLAVSAALLSVFLAVFGAYSFSRLRYRGQAVVQRGVLFVYMIGGILLLIPLYRMAAAMGLLATPAGTFGALLIIYLVQTLPVSLYMLGNFFRTIPYSIEEAALIEGVSRFGVIWRIILPLAASAIATVFIYAFMIAWNEYLFASVFLKSYQGLYTLPIGLRTLFVSKNAIWDRIMAGSMLTALPVIILFMAIQKKLTGGLSEGGVKG